MLLQRVHLLVLTHFMNRKFNQWLSTITQTSTRETTISHFKSLSTQRPRHMTINLITSSSINNKIGWSTPTITIFSYFVFNNKRQPPKHKWSQAKKCFKCRHVTCCLASNISCVYNPSVREICVVPEDTNSNPNWQCNSSLFCSIPYFPDILYDL